MLIPSYNGKMEFPTYEGVEVLRLPPPGVDVDFNDRTPNPAIQATYIITGVGMSLAFIALMQRYYTKIFLAKGLQLDDCKSRETCREKHE